MTAARQIYTGAIAESLIYIEEILLLTANQISVKFKFKPDQSMTDWVILKQSLKDRIEYNNRIIRIVSNKKIQS